MIIFGESFLNLNFADYLFNSFKNFLLKNNKFTNNWNPLNILSVDASRVGSLDLDIVNENEELIKDLNERLFIC